VQRRDGHLDGGVARDHDGLGAGLDAAQVREQIEAALARQLDVEQRDVEIIALERAHRLVRVGVRPHVERAPEHLAPRLEEDDVVVDDGYTRESITRRRHLPLLHVAALRRRGSST
jgi:6-phosphogluconate dehydrogenase (decarboxylating)